VGFTAHLQVEGEAYMILQITMLCNL